MLETDYREEFCLARDFDENFVRSLMEAGFLVMSMELEADIDSTDSADSGDDEGKADKSGRFFILMPKLHLVRSALFFPDLHIKKSIHPLLSKYELRVDTDFDLIVDKCLAQHGEDWLTPPLVEIIKSMRRNSVASQNEPQSAALNIAHNAGVTRARPFSFGVYRDGELKAGEFGILMGRVYTSYSGYFDEKNAGTVQMILMTQWMEKSDFDFLDFGMPLDYKTDLGAQDIQPRRFVELFRKARA